MHPRWSTACQAFGKNFRENSPETSILRISPASAHSPTLSCAHTTMSGPLPACAAIGKVSVTFPGVSIVILIPKSSSNFCAIGARPRARPLARSLSIQMESSPLVQADRFIGSKARANRTGDNFIFKDSGLRHSRTGGRVPVQSGALKARLAQAC